MKNNYLPNIYFKNTDPDDSGEDDGGKGGGSGNGETDDTNPV
ncbi:hypothetical protein [Gracilimonas sp.]|nr:hypothetical protein [Gracilimonas sp.]